MKNFFLFGLISTALLSCNPVGNDSEQKTYFDLAGFIDAEIKYMDAQNVTVLKTVKINKETEELESTKIDWNKELEILKQSDLNKAAFKLSYDISETDSLISYKLKEGENLPVALVKILKDKNGEIVEIESKYHTENYLYNSSKTAQINLKNGHLNSYSMIGWQELFIGSRKNFEIKGVVQ
jgi:hypothetical protein